MDDELRLSAVVGGSLPPCELRATLSVPATHPLLAGHFPGAPLVPGVLLLEAVRLAWARATGRPAAIVAVDDVRWFAPVMPGADVNLRGQVAAVADGVAITGEWQDGGRRVATFAVRLAEPAAAGAARA